MRVIRAANWRPAEARQFSLQQELIARLPRHDRGVAVHAEHARDLRGHLAAGHGADPQHKPSGRQ